MDSVLSEELSKRIMIKPGLMGGKPVVRGLRFPVVDILEMLASGMSSQEILDQHPILEADDIKASLLYATHRLNHTTISYGVFL